MGSFTRAFVLLLIGINAANATHQLPNVIKQLNDIAAATSQGAADLTGHVRDAVKKTNDETNDFLETLRKTVGSNIEGAVSFVANQWTPEDAPACLKDGEAKVSKLIRSTAEEVSKCLSTPFTSITKSIENLVVAGDSATKAANSYVKRIEECNDNSEKAYCLANILFNAQGTVAGLFSSTSQEVINIGTTVAGFQTTIASCKTEAFILAFIKSIDIGSQVSLCTLETLVGLWS